MSSTAALGTQDEKMSSLGLTKTIVNNEKVCCYSRDLGAVSKKNPVLVLVHGYPQSSYMWRHFIPLLPSTAPLFVPDMPGYGASAPTEKMDKLTVGNALMDALKSEVSKARTSSDAQGDIPIVIISHDRGARVAHRLAVSGVAGVDIRGVCLIDIVPTSTQWQHNASPTTAAKEVTGYFHWPFLANVSLATRMITALGPSTFCTDMIQRWAGSGLSNLTADSALPLYGALFAQPHVLKASCEDYAAGATVDLEMQAADQEAGRKIKCPTLLLYSSGGIGSRFAFPDVWREWVGDGVEIEDRPLGGGVGHFGAEEAPEESAEVVGEWLARLAGGAA
ncbi:alpha/beta-hydrolase [Dothidotthia symphoricarpi CBS 119687]|uniref:Alpha/beta-hydrolase n=1 Tax=Dothidotthia symphoricarpi CBS 119687 TaxID=1392245 RepID=A0A6A5ZX68_9PLEO|nr:alpha/beta-hydrolase [Dothidotthia symphoricarpi CBS 119687]KAF2124180.1 alpha/beta-hydrolase [Dothidotthia symphoricarpi CBS 119687]